jgi:RHS repeat-associated protein
VRETAFSTTAAKNAPESTTRVLFWYHPDYIGNVDLVTERDGKTYEFFTYNPWGEEMHQYNANTFSFSSPYRFNSKEKDQETGLHYYGARYYQSKLSVWLSVDPLAHVAPGWTPYRFNFDNPIKFTDPTGLLEDHEYSVDKLGNVKKEKHVEGSTEDHLHKKENWDKGITNEGITVNDQNLLPQLTGQDNTQYKAPQYNTDLSGHVANTSNSKDAEKIFKFSADNTDVEWNLQDYTDGSSAVSTAHDGSETLGGKMNKTNAEKTIAREIHNHPGTSKDDFRPSGYDTVRATNQKTRNPDARNFLYMPKQPNPNARILDVGNNKWVNTWNI